MIVSTNPAPKRNARRSREGDIKYFNPPARPLRIMSVDIDPGDVNSGHHLILQSRLIFNDLILDRRRGSPWFPC
jgi:hypothetical protein